MPSHDHWLFTQVYRLIARAEEVSPIAAARTKVAAGLRGRLLIVGLGPGGDLAHVPATVTHVVGVEPSASMRQAAHGAVQQARARGIQVEVIDAVGEDLPFASDSFDSALLAYVLCSVDDPAQVVAEVRRVLRPGGEVAVLEHVVGHDGTWMRRAQRLAAPWWPRIAGGCRCDQDTAAVLAAGGFDTSRLRHVESVPLPPVGPALIGTARVVD